MFNLSDDIKARITDTVARELGVAPPRVELTGERFIRWSAKKGGGANCYLRIAVDGEPRVIFGDWASGVKQVINLRELADLAPEDRERLSQEAANVAKRDAKARAQAAVDMLAEWERAQPGEGNLYTRQKGYEPKGLRFDAKGNAIVPISIDGKKASYQWIAKDGSRGFRRNCPVKGGYFIIGEITNDADTILICEGWSTGAAINAATDRPVVVAFSASNLTGVAKYFRANYPQAKIIVCGDDDRKHVTSGLENIGRTQATRAARAVNGSAIFPQFTSDNLDLSDFHDMSAFEGRAIVADYINATIAEHVPNDAEPDDNCMLDCDEQSEPIPLDEIAAEITRVSKLSDLEYDWVRDDVAKRLGVRTKTLDDERKKLRAEDSLQTKAVVCADIEPYDEPVVVSELLYEIYSTVSRFIVCDEQTKVAASIWIAFTWVIDYVDIAPIALITAPDKECGKSQLLEVLRRLSRRSVLAANISPSALFRTIEKYSPTICLDEADTFLKENEELRGLINSGHARDQAQIIRCVGDDHEPAVFSTWCAKAISGIGKLAETIMSRSIEMPMRRKLKSEAVERLRTRNKSDFDHIAAKLARFSIDYGSAIGAARPDTPQTLGDRAADNWEPLFAIADLAGEGWPERARHAAVTIAVSATKTLSRSQEMLHSVREAFDRDRADKLTRDELLARILEDEEGPWATWVRGHPMTARQMLSKIEEYDIKISIIKVDGKSQRGFYRRQFEDAWARYLDGTEPETASESEKLHFESVTRNQNVTHKSLNNNDNGQKVTELRFFPGDARAHDYNSSSLQHEHETLL